MNLISASLPRIAGSNGMAKVVVKWSDLKISSKQFVRDLWRQKNLGQFDKEFALSIPPHGAELVKISRKAAQ